MLLTVIQTMSVVNCTLDGRLFANLTGDEILALSDEDAENMALWAIEDSQRCREDSQRCREDSQRCRAESQRKREIYQQELKAFNSFFMGCALMGSNSK